MSTSAPVLIVRSMRLLWSSARLPVIGVVLLSIVYGAAPVGILLIGSRIIDRIIQAAGTSSSASVGEGLFNHRGIVLLVVLLLVLTFAVDGVQTIFGLALDTVRDRSRVAAKEQFLQCVLDTETLNVFEDPDSLDELDLGMEGLKQLSVLPNTAGSVLSGLFVLIPSVAILFSLRWWMPVVILLAIIPAVVVQGKVEEDSWDVQRSHATNARRSDVIERMMWDPRLAADIRVYESRTTLHSEWFRLKHLILRDLIAIRVQSSFRVIRWSLLSGGVVGLCYVYLVNAALAGQITIGEIALYTGLVLEIRRFLEAIVYRGGDAYRAVLGLEPFFNALDSDFDDEMPLTAVGRIVPRLEPAEIVGFQDVSFTYPHGNRAAVSCVSFSVVAGERVALVGANGSGKSTLIKLLSGLYQPHSGAICVRGEMLQGDVRAAWRRGLALVMQDVGRPTVSVASFFGDHAGVLSPQSFDALRLAGLPELPALLPAGGDTVLSKQVEGGIDLSGGQWQRLALARAIKRTMASDDGFVLLDEPTSAIDPGTESKLFEIFARVMAERGGIVVSHRLSLCRLMDRILVMDGGELVEDGSHEELIAAGSLYAEMFRQQARGYIDSVPSVR